MIETALILLRAIKLIQLSLFHRIPWSRLPNSQEAERYLGSSRLSIVARIQLRFMSRKLARTLLWRNCVRDSDYVQVRTRLFDFGSLWKDKNTPELSWRFHQMLFDSSSYSVRDETLFPRVVRDQSVRKDKLDIHLFKQNGLPCLRQTSDGFRVLGEASCLRKCSPRKHARNLLFVYLIPVSIQASHLVTFREQMSL